MEQLSIALLWAQIAAEASVGLAQCAVVAYHLGKMQKYHQERSRILDEQEARWRELFDRQDQMLWLSRQTRPDPSS